MEIAREAKELAKSLGVSRGVSEKSLEREALVQETIDQEFPWIKPLYKNNVVSTNALYELFTKAKDKLQKIANLPPTERNQLLTTREGRKIILERDDLLDLILQHKMAVSQAINKLKIDEKIAKAKKKPKAKDEEEDEGEEIETIDREDSESEEYDLVGEWKKAEDEEAKQQLTPQFNVNEINNDLESYLKQLVTEGFVELDKTKLYLVTLDGKTYLINARAVNELKSGKGVGKYKKLEEFIQSKGLGFYDPEEGAYSISYQLLA